MKRYTGTQAQIAHSEEPRTLLPGVPHRRARMLTALHVGHVEDKSPSASASVTARIHSSLPQFGQAVSGSPA